MSRKIKPIPKFKTLEEEREFWDTHNSTEYFPPDEFEDLKLSRKKDKIVHIYVAPNGTRYEMRKLPRKRPVLAHNPPSRSKNGKKKTRTRREPFLVE